MAKAQPATKKQTASKAPAAPEKTTPEKAPSAKYKYLSVGDPAPWFKQAATSNENYAFDTAGGRYIVLCFFGSAGQPESTEALSILKSNRKLFDDDKIAFFGVSADPADRETGRVQESLPGIRHFWDFNGAAARAYGVLPVEGGNRLRPQWFVLDPTMRIMKMVPFKNDGSDKKEIVDFLKKLPAVNMFSGIELQAPILYLPNVFEPEFCQRLIGIYESGEAQDSGFMRQVGEKTVAMKDYGMKRRSDVTLTDEKLMDEIRFRIRRRVNPEIQKVHAFAATRIERFIVACYDAETGGHFRAHRDNLTLGTAHRRFAVSINLNNDFEGGEVSFPEYGSRSFKPPAGGAVVFNCSLLHEVSKVTKGRRFAFLPFLYDDAAAVIRAANAGSLEV